MLHELLGPSNLRCFEVKLDRFERFHSTLPPEGDATLDAYAVGDDCRNGDGPLTHKYDMTRDPVWADAPDSVIIDLRKPETWPIARVPGSPFTDDEIRDIRADKRSLRAIGSRYGVSGEHIRKIKARIIYAEVP